MSRATGPAESRRPPAIHRRPNFLLKNYLRPIGVPLLACALVPLLSACSDGPSGPDAPPPPDLSTPEGVIIALEDFYSRRQAEPAIGLLGPDYHFIPALPEEIPFFDSSMTQWERGTEVDILTELLVPERTTWIDQVLLEITKRTRIDRGDEVEIEADVQLSLLVGQDQFEKARSTITMLFRRNADGDFALVEEREVLSDAPDILLTVGEQKARVLVPQE